MEAEDNLKLKKTPWERGCKYFFHLLNNLHHYRVPSGA